MGGGWSGLVSQTWECHLGKRSLRPTKLMVKFKVSNQWCFPKRNQPCVSFSQSLIVFLSLNPTKLWLFHNVNHSVVIGICGRKVGHIGHRCSRAPCVTVSDTKRRGKVMIFDAVRYTGVNAELCGKACHLQFLTLDSISSDLLILLPS